MVQITDTCLPEVDSIRRKWRDREGGDQMGSIRQVGVRDLPALASRIG